MTSKITNYVKSLTPLLLSLGLIYDMSRRGVNGPELLLIILFSIPVFIFSYESYKKTQELGKFINALMAIVGLSMAIYYSFNLILYLGLGNVGGF